jgi:hypothetical protein
VAGSPNALNGDAVVDEVVVHHRVVVNNGGLVVEAPHLGGRQTMMVNVVRAEIAERDKREGIYAQAKAEVCSYRNPVIAPPDADREICARRQGRPAASGPH